jgi:hypothetical protein
MVLSQRTSDIRNALLLLQIYIYALSGRTLITVNDYNVLNEHSRLLTRTKKSSASLLSKNYPLIIQCLVRHITILSYRAEAFGTVFLAVVVSHRNLRTLCTRSRGRQSLLDVDSSCDSRHLRHCSSCLTFCSLFGSRQANTQYPQKRNHGHPDRNTSSARASK